MAFDMTALRGFSNEIKVGVAGMNAAAASRAIAAEAYAQRDRVLRERGLQGGMMLPYRQVVDSIEGAPIEGVRPDGYVAFYWSYLSEVVAAVYDLMRSTAPVESGHYRDGIAIFVDGSERTLDQINIDTAEVTIVATADYSRKLEVGWKNHTRVLIQEGKHYVEKARVVAARLYGDLAIIEFTYVDLPDAWHIQDKRGWRRRHGRTEEHVRYPAIKLRWRTA